MYNVTFYTVQVPLSITLYKTNPQLYNVICYYTVLD